MAAAAGLTDKTLRQLEQGRGNLDSWHAVLEQLGLELAGRNLPPGATLGDRLAALRRRRRRGQRALAELVGVSPPTVVALERQGGGRLDTLERVLETLGAGAYLAPTGQGRAFYTHAGNASVSHKWETTVELLDALHTVFGRFDLDPCAPRKTRTRVRAKRHLTAGDDGLSAPWRGVVFVNPPYGRGLARWVAKARREVELGHAEAVVALLPARPDTAYWHDHVAGRAVVYFLRGRLRFGAGGNSAPFPSALAVWGARPEIIAALDVALVGAWRAG
jgi:transcriptional regulator with XRE-family HTH domain